MGSGVSKGPEPFVILLTSSIPQGQLDTPTVYPAIGDIIFEDGWDVMCREISQGEHGEKRGLSTRAIANDDKFPAYTIGSRSQSEVGKDLTFSSHLATSLR